MLQFVYVHMPTLFPFRMPNFKNQTLLDKQQQLWPYMMYWRITRNKLHSCGVYGCGAGDSNGNLYPMVNGDGICHLVRYVLFTPLFAGILCVATFALTFGNSLNFKCEKSALLTFCLFFFSLLPLD